MATWWSTRADGDKIFYKLKEHLESHYKIWQGHRKTHESLTSSREQRQANRRRIRAPGHISHVLPAADRENPGIIPTAISDPLPMLPEKQTFPNADVPDHLGQGHDPVAFNDFEMEQVSTDFNTLDVQPVVEPSLPLQYNQATSHQFYSTGLSTFQTSFWEPPVPQASVEQLNQSQNERENVRSVSEQAEQVGTVLGKPVEKGANFWHIAKDKNFLNGTWA
ncbi:hypothetical protein FB451DRAFT_1373561 [Mycena latifolia]|nr:hypothetical protein FB451DRAFT_1373561 [Mycena latifolia]